MRSFLRDYLDGDEACWLDRFLPETALTFVALVFGFPLSLTVGAAIAYHHAGRGSEFLKSHEWQTQWAFLALMLLMQRVLMRWYFARLREGLAAMDVDPALLLSEATAKVGSSSLLLGAIPALAYTWVDAGFISSPEYLGQPGAQGVSAPGFADYLLAGLWGLEWWIAAYLWVSLSRLSFLVGRVFRASEFREPIDVVLRERRYEPFLRAFTGGSVIYCGMMVCASAYIWWTGGDLYDYSGLLLTAVAAVAGFVHPWHRITHHIRRRVGEVRDECNARLAELFSAQDRDRPQNLPAIEVQHFHLEYIDRLYRERDPGTFEARKVLWTVLAGALSTLLPVVVQALLS